MRLNANANVNANLCVCVCVIKSVVLRMCSKANSSKVSAATARAAELQNVPFSFSFL